MEDGPLPTLIKTANAKMSAPNIEIVAMAITHAWGTEMEEITPAALTTLTDDGAQSLLKLGTIRAKDYKGEEKEIDVKQGHIAAFLLALKAAKAAAAAQEAAARATAAVAAQVAAATMAVVAAIAASPAQTRLTVHRTSAACGKISIPSAKCSSPVLPLWLQMQLQADHCSCRTRQASVRQSLR